MHTSGVCWINDTVSSLLFDTRCDARGLIANTVSVFFWGLRRLIALKSFHDAYISSKRMSIDLLYRHTQKRTIPNKMTNMATVPPPRMPVTSSICLLMIRYSTSKLCCRKLEGRRRWRNITGRGLTRQRHNQW